MVFALLRVAVIVAVTFAPGFFVVMVNVPLVEPAGMIVVAGTTAAPLEELRLTESPPAGAALEIVRVPVEVAGSVTVVGLTVSAVIVGALIAKDALAAVACPFRLALMVAVAFALTATVGTVKVPVVAPAAIVAVEGVAAALLDAIVTVRPPTGAALLIVMEPFEVLPPTRVVGLSDRAVTVGPLTVRVAVC